MRRGSLASSGASLLLGLAFSASALVFAYRPAAAPQWGSQMPATAQAVQQSSATAAVLPAPAATPLPAPPPAPSAPPRIQMPELGIDLPIRPGDGVEPPVGEADLYPGTKWPGQGGKSFVYAHARPGMFGPLLAAGAVGEQVRVQEPDGTVYAYRITSYTRNWPVYDLSILQPTDHEVLVLYTCTSWTYTDPKVVAIAEPDPSGWVVARPPIKKVPLTGPVSYTA